MIQRIIVLVAALCAASMASAGEKFPSISHSELKQAIQEKEVVLLDVNGTETYQNGHIPGAIDFTAKSGEIAKVLPPNKDALVVAYCANENCPAYARAAQAARELGYKNVKHYSPGIDGWKKAGEKVEKAG